MCTEAMDTKEGDAIMKMILEKTQMRTERRQRRSASARGWEMGVTDIPRPLSIPLPEQRETGEKPDE